MSARKIHLHNYGTALSFNICGTPHIPGKDWSKGLTYKLDSGELHSITCKRCIQKWYQLRNKRIQEGRIMKRKGLSIAERWKKAAQEVEKLANSLRLPELHRYADMLLVESGAQEFTDILQKGKADLNRKKAELTLRGIPHCPICGDEGTFTYGECLACAML